MENCLLEIIQTKIVTKDNQFGFKKQQGTDLNNLVLKEIIREYNSKRTSVFICYMDASKAFARVNHQKLFDMLLKSKVPVYIVRLLAYW